MDKIKISSKEFDELYEITEETESTADEPISDKQDTTPEFLTTEEQEQDDLLEKTLDWNEEKIDA